jgi:hypothetical protein
VAAQEGVAVWVQRVVPIGHTLVHALLLQNWPEGQTFPQAPQFCWSDLRSAQPEGQVDSGAAHVTVQLPASHRVPASHRAPHVPQFSPSLAVETQRCMPVGPQATLPPGHELEQLPPVQNVPSAQTLPHMPQCRLSLRVSIHKPPQVDSGAPQDTRQVPSWQRDPAAQTVPHAPQFAESLCTSTHRPAQSVHG